MGNHQFAMVWEWMENGNIIEFIKSHGDANRFELVGFRSYYSPQSSLRISSDSSKTSLRG